jgi:predicted transcriptional regulator
MEQIRVHVATNDDEQASCHSIQLQILNKLMSCTKSFKAIELSKLLGIPKATLNNALYSLRRRGKIKCTTGSPPLWAYDQESGGVVDSEKGVLNLLTTKASPMSSHSIAWELNISKAVANRIMYDLERIGKVERLQISPPIWITKRQIFPGSEGQQRNEIDIPADGIRSKKRRRVEDEGIFQNKSSAITSDAAGKEKRDSNEENNNSQQEETSLLLKNNQNVHSCNQKGDVDPDSSKKIANAVWKKYKALHPSDDKVILAGYVLRTRVAAKNETLEVIALGTGTKALPGNNYCLTGSVVHDCHAEIIARRSLMRWIYKQIATADEPQSYAIKNADEGKPFKLRASELWLYISQAPCGDAAVFSRNDPTPVTVPCYTTHNHGMFRTKTEAQNGGNVNVKYSVVQSFDGLQLGNRSKCLTCSDKLAKRCFVGVQGALLSQLIPPLYMSGIVIGDVFSHSHVARALCCRSEKALRNYGGLSPIYSLHHPKIGHWPIKITRIEQIGTNKNKWSINWAWGDNDVEILDATTGKLQNKGTSRLSKKALFPIFLRLCKRKPSSRSTYKESKSQSTEYQHSKNIWIDAMSKTFETSWTRKPSEVEDFYDDKSVPLDIT